jgi:hypothetical protein
MHSKGAARPLGCKDYACCGSLDTRIVFAPQTAALGPASLTSSLRARLFKTEATVTAQHSLEVYSFWRLACTPAKNCIPQGCASLHRNLPVAQNCIYAPKTP